MRIFISHSHQDAWAARKIAEDLKQRGADTFLAEKNISTGDSIDESVTRNLENCDHLLVLISPASRQSSWVLVEIGMARALRKRVIPILFYVGINELPSPIADLLARDINDIERYYQDLDSEPSSSAIPDIARSEAKPVIRRNQREIGKGVKVRVVDHLLLSEMEKKQPPVWVPEMDKYSGRESVVTSTSPDGLIALENIPHYFRKEWVELSSGEKGTSSK